MHETFPPDFVPLCFLRASVLHMQSHVGTQVKRQKQLELFRPLHLSLALNKAQSLDSFGSGDRNAATMVDEALGTL